MSAFMVDKYSSYTDNFIKLLDKTQQKNITFLVCFILGVMINELVINKLFEKWHHINYKNALKNFNHFITKTKELKYDFEKLLTNLPESPPHIY